MVLDHPEITRRLFYPRREGKGSEATAQSVFIPVEEGVDVGGYIYETDRPRAEIVFFHGNGEIAADYDDIAPLFTTRGIGFFVFDYRGYGRSGGFPTVSLMLSDAHRIFSWVKARRESQATSGPLIVMGRSLGSASALELAAHYPDDIHGLIVESGFARTGPLLRLLGIDLHRIGFREEEGLRQLEKIAAFKRPTLIIHAQYDSLIPIAEGRRLYEASPAEVKAFCEIPGADHNSIFALGLALYLKKVEWLVEKAQEG
ncbi:MAG TPA: alpha/beta fold hydrolase [Syntrophales bacterium]|nr:alpha/beta fold hydrolase [Syntrophales bacterium]HOL58564.1 alpha/beta fold hydrolase [Syntrophales bacterium]HPO34828.1 alpha/beta fold hydrolase [Syntrophales bacterium]